MVLINITAYGRSSWLPIYLTKTYHLSLKIAVYLLAVNAIWQIIGNLGTGMILSKWFVGQQKCFLLLF